MAAVNKLLYFQENMHLEKMNVTVSIYVTQTTYSAKCVLNRLVLANITIFKVHFSIAYTNYAALSKWTATLAWILSLGAVAPPLV